jgi:hypothetical protein
MAALIYTLCAATSCLCTLLLLRSYSRTKYRLLFWAGLCFVGITLNNLLLVADKLFYPQGDLLTLRLLVALIALILLLYGLIFE